jgi:hypothetical protein
MSRQVNSGGADLEAERAALQAELSKAKASLGPSAAARRKRGKELKEAVVNSRRLRSSDRSETVISFRGSQALKDRLALKRSASRAGGEKFNEWMERVIEAALDAEQRDAS